jgi:hypothetical protein
MHDIAAICGYWPEILINQDPHKIYVNNGNTVVKGFVDNTSCVSS